MLLTEAVRIVGLMSSPACRVAFSAADTDPLLRAVCGWRLSPTTRAQYARLADVAGIGQPAGHTNARSAHNPCTTQQCIADELQRSGPLGCTGPWLATHCQCTPGAAVVTIHRLRAAGQTIDWKTGGRYSDGAYVWGAPAPPRGEVSHD